MMCLKKLTVLLPSTPAVVRYCRSVTDTDSRHYHRQALGNTYWLT
jgi:hypothetical protein